jgi:hypothetical protein
MRLRGGVARPRALSNPTRSWRPRPPRLPPPPCPHPTPLRSALPHISGWVVCDTGSSDATKAVAARALEPTGLPGRLVDHEWSNFGSNRKACLDEAVGLNVAPPGAPPAGCTHYLLLDADDTVRGTTPEFTLKTADLGAHVFSWMVSHYPPGGELARVYELKRLVSAARAWTYVGVTHEYISPADGGPDFTVHLPEFQARGRRGWGVWGLGSLGVRSREVVELGAVAGRRAPAGDAPARLPPAERAAGRPSPSGSTCSPLHRPSHHPNLQKHAGRPPRRRRLPRRQV